MTLKTFIKETLNHCEDGEIEFDLGVYSHFGEIHVADYGDTKVLSRVKFKLVKEKA